MKEGRKEERKNEKEDREVHSFLFNSIAILIVKNRHIERNNWCLYKLLNY